MSDRLISALTALTAPSDGDYLPIVDVSEGAATAKNKRITIEELFRNSASKFSFTQNGVGATARTIDSKLKDVVSVKDFGAIGNGVVNDTAAIQAALDSAKAVYFPEGTYLVTTINPKDEAHLIGAGKYASTINGQIVCGDGTGAIREIELSHLKVTGSSYSVTFDVCPDFRIFDCNITRGVLVKLSVRGAILNSDITNSGAGNWAIKTQDYCNGLVIRDNVLSGGTVGGAVNVRGPLTGGTITGNVIESSLHGIWVASEAIVTAGDAGACTGVIIDGNYIEQCSTPFYIAKVFTGTGFRISNNYIGNSSTSVIATRTACYSFSRLRNSTVTNNDADLLNNVENFIDVEIKSGAIDFDQNIVANNRYDNTPPTVFNISGAGSATASLLRTMGGTNYIDLLANISIQSKNYPGHSSTEARVYTSREFKANETVNSLAWLLGTGLALGGTITNVEVVEVVGALTGCRLRIGDTSINNRVVDVADLSALTYTNGTSVSALQKSIVSSTNATPIAVTVTAHGYSTGDIVVIAGHTTNTNANGTWVITNTGANTFTLNGSVGNGIGGATGTALLRNVTGVVFNSTVHNIITVTAGAGTGLFRVRITYRAT